MRKRRGLLVLTMLIMGLPGIAAGGEPDPNAVRELMKKYEREEAKKATPAPKPQPKPRAPVKPPLPAGSRPPPSQVFRDTLSDGTRGPAMVVIPGGDFQMGSLANELRREADERPHRVHVDGFAMGQYEVTFEEYDRFCAATRCEKPSDESWGRGRRPVIYVSWNDAMAYAEWLSQQTGKQYRLPTEAEWEYAARAGTTTPFWTGRCVNTDQANYTGIFNDSLPPDCEAKKDDGLVGTQPVGSYKPNPWGLYDTMGNVREWTCSAYDQEYGGAEQKCAKKDATGPLVVRGGSWTDSPAWVRSAYRYRVDPTPRDPYFQGFRLARSL
jgi:formylglycine-generating enzyme required for sulfatase activity